ncbi:MAG: glycoside hydrolase family 13 protein [Ruminococcaceae bacterium]|nr:glycoside hydrolase family 13 protein [Oscillospiraceae bacterium]
MNYNRDVIYNSRDIFFKKPFGAVKNGTQVLFRIRWPNDEEAFLTILRDAKDAVDKVPLKYNPSTGMHEVSYTFSDIGLFYYRFGGDSGFVGRKHPSSEGFLTKDKSSGWFIQFVYDKNFKAPEGFEGKVIYQIFPDRFHRENVIETEFDDRIIHTDLRTQPLFRPVSGKVWNNDYFGGNLDGIVRKLPYLKSLNVGIIYLNPIFEAHSNHRYNTANYMKVDPLLGTNDDFARLAKEAAKADIKIILDGVFSHTGSDSIYFNKYGRYGDGGAYRDINSPYRSWYQFDKSKAGYKSWWGFDTLPEVNENDEGYREFICKEGGVIDYWLKMGASGFRLDVADELPDEFITEIRKAVKRNGDDKILIGEVWEDAATKISYGRRRKFLWGNSLDSVMNYPFMNAITDFISNGNAALFIDNVMSVVENYPKPMMDITMNHLSTHDTRRIITALVYKGKTGDREWQSVQHLNKDDYLRGVEMVKLAFVTMATLPGLPTIYYGDEIGMQGFSDPFNRAYFEWDNIDENLLSFVRMIMNVRSEHSAFANGTIVPLRAENGCVAYIRENDEEKILVAINRGEFDEIVRYKSRCFLVKPWSFRIQKL